PDSLSLKEEEPTAPPGLEEKKSSPVASTSGKGKEDDAQPPKVGGEYLVQAGSFKNINKAEELSKKIIALGYKPRVATTEVAGKGKWSRVVIDGFATKDEAKTAAGVLSEKIKSVNCIVRPIK
ncbi:MAG: SPOR domain-containing protein, partial [Syntrophales bacterium]|nr:SPOR domain-containing protein [Syntrophales bacterium]